MESIYVYIFAPFLFFIFIFLEGGIFVTLPKSGRPTKINPRVQRRVIQEVIK